MRDEYVAIGERMCVEVSSIAGSFMTDVQVLERSGFVEGLTSSVRCLHWFKNGRTEKTLTAPNIPLA